MPEQEAKKIDNKTSDENTRNTLSSIDKLLSIAEASEERISRNNQVVLIVILSLSFTFTVFISIIRFEPDKSTILGWILGWLSSNSTNYLPITLAFSVPTIFLLNKFFKVRKNTKKEMFTFKESLKVVQEILPYYFDKMSALEKTIYNIRLSRLDIVATEAQQEKNKPLVQK